MLHLHILKHLLCVELRFNQNVLKHLINLFGEENKMFS